MAATAPKPFPPPTAGPARRSPRAELRGRVGRQQPIAGRPRPSAAAPLGDPASSWEGRAREAGSGWEWNGGVSGVPGATGSRCGAAAAAGPVRAVCVPVRPRRRLRCEEGGAALPLSLPSPPKMNYMPGTASLIEDIDRLGKGE
ncbi:U6 snRNA-associated Sm-like protein LSm1 isoform X2 [Ochotona princeps]|uniref:U6 snRNA-associated Sm-like protein LSm1 isoform X2 n=1 Tax=Ochotona princeps TaxID=9978 RepID=UPI002714E03F|nr:U6 snRNA-associated Sm-like protein LSm1 isoform X2 [Ochotona princeps]